jgi:hypothetical protein
MNRGGVKTAKVCCRVKPKKKISRVFDVVDVNLKKKGEETVGIMENRNGFLNKGE